MKKLKIGDLVFVETRDIEHESQGWIDVRSVRQIKPLRFCFVGWVVKDTKQFLQLAASMSPTQKKLFCVYRLPKGPGFRVRKFKGPRRQHEVL